jgi:hypothetical protein
MKYRKKPVVIDAVQFDGTYECYINDIVPFCGYDNLGRYIIDKFLIKTLEGTHLAIKGDWIIKGVNGEFYACKPDIFEKTYEKVEE